MGFAATPQFQAWKSAQRWAQDGVATHDERAWTASSSGEIWRDVKLIDIGGGYVRVDR